MAARIRTIFHDERTRLKIKTSQLVNRLNKHALGEVEMTPTQIKAAEILLSKTLPNLQSVAHSGELSMKHNAADWSKDELVAIIATASSSGTAETDGCDGTSGSVH